MPLQEQTDDEIYVHAFRRVVKPLLEAFTPDIVVAEIGADSIVSDPLTHLRLTNNGYREVVRELCKYSPALVAVGGGGYDVYRSAQCWALAWAAMSEQDPADDHAAFVGGAIHGAEMDCLFERPMRTRGAPKALAREQAHRVVSYIHREVFPIFGARGP